MREYQVTVPLAGAIYMTVHAENEDEAIEHVLENCTIDDIGEWEAMRYIVRGNVCSAPVWEASVEDWGEVDSAQGIETASADETAQQAQPEG